MGISYDEAVKAQAEIEDILMEDPNIVSVGVIADTDGFGRHTGNYAIKVGVISIEAYQNALKNGRSTIPSEHILRLDNGGEEKHVRINVVKTGQIAALTQDTNSKNKKMPSATVNKYPSGNMHTFNADYSFRILKRHFYTKAVAFPKPTPCSARICLRALPSSRVKLGIFLTSFGIYAACTSHATPKALQLNNSRSLFKFP